MVHRRELGGEAIWFGNQGGLWGNAMTWFDHATGSVWSQPLGLAIAGPRRGQRLDLLPALLTSWGAWREAYPHTVALSARGGRSGFDLQAMVIVVELEGAAVAYPVPALRRNGVINDELAGVPIAAVVDPRSPDRWNVFSRRTGSGVAELTVQEQGIHDAQSDTVWDPTTGLVRSGPPDAQPLLPIPALTFIPARFPHLLARRPLLDRAPLTAPQQHVALRRSGATTSRGDRRAEP